MGLLNAFRAALSRSQREQLSARAEAWLSKSVAEAEERWFPVRVPHGELAKHVAQKLEAVRDVGDGLAKLKVADLYLALACARGDEAAIAKLEKDVGADLRRALAPYRLDAASSDELLQRLRAKILVGDGRPPRIIEYAGVGPLGAWLSATVARLAIDLMRARSEPVESDETLLDKVEDPGDLELQVIKQRYRAEFREAFQAAFKGLTPEERNLLRFHFMDGLNIEQIGAMQGVHRSTVARRIARIREELLQRTRTTLRTLFRLSASEVNSLLRVVKSDFGMSLSSVLKSR